MENNTKSNETRNRTHILELTAELVKATNANISEDDLSAIVSNTGKLTHLTD